MAVKVASTEADYDPICPHCEKKLNEVHWRKIQAAFFHEYIFFCPKCKKVIGVTAAR
jgi:hypothetical protein